jgi:uncharacterized protein (TIGR03435 family)
MRKVISGIVAITLACPVAFAQSSRSAFEITSVKPNNSGGPPRRIGTEGNRFIAENAPLILLIQMAYRSPGGGLLRDQVIGGPAWIDTDRFDVEAKIEGDTRAIPTVQVWLMVQSLLEDRFKLKVHRGTRELPIYNLVVARGGVKMKLSPDQTLPNFDGQPDVDDRFDPSVAPARGLMTTTYSPSHETVLWGTAIPISPNLAIQRPHALPPQSLTLLLWGYAGRPVIDKTNLKGLYDFRLQFTPERLPGNPDVSGPSIFTAIQEQLGLRLESTKGPVEVLVIDHVERPSEN